MSAATHSTPAPVTRKIVIASLASLLAAIVLVVAAVLPAEYGIDPLGTGRALGLLALSGSGPAAVVPQSKPYRVDSATFTLERFQSLEYTYEMEQGAGMIYSWTSTGEVRYDFHGQPRGAPIDYAESFDRRQNTEAHGTFIAPFAGTTGWHWENISGGPVTITLTTSGFYDQPRQFFDGRQYFHELRAPK